jgi:Ras-related protein Rab-2A
VLAYDITNRDSFANIDTWLKECRDMCPKTIVMILAGNKVDLESKRVVSYAEGEEFAKRNNLIFVETSALTGHNIDNMFSLAAKELIDKVEDGTYELKDEVSYCMLIC